MYSPIKKGWAGVALFGLLLAMLSLQASKPAACLECTCVAPANGTKTGQTSTSVSFTWSAASGATSYDVWYYRSDDNYTSPESNLTGTSINFTSLPAGNYVFYISTNCGDTSSDIIILEDILMG